MPALASILAEFRQRRVIRALSVYAGIMWLVIGLSDVALPFLGAPEWMMRGVIWVSLLGLPVVATVSWLFDLLPSAAAPDAAETAPGHSPWEIVVIVLLLGAVAVSIALILSRSAEPEGLPDSRTPSVAVLPFVDMSSAGDQAYFGDGLAEEILNLLAQNPALQVAARTSSFRFRDARESVEAIGVKLGVAHLLEGSVRIEGERLRVTAQLVSTRDGYHLWSETFEDDFRDVFAIQDLMANQIAVAMQANVLDSATAPRTDPQLYLTFLRAGYLARRGSREDLEEAALLYRQVVAGDPAYAPGWLRMGVVLSNLAAQGHRPYQQTFEEARTAVLTAIELDPTQAAGHAQLAWILHRYDGDLGASAAAMQRAIDLAPYDFNVLAGAAVLMLQLGQLEDAVDLLGHCAQRSPLEARVFFNLAVALKYAGEYGAAEARLDRVERLSPDYHGVAYQRAELAFLQGRYAEAAQAFSALEAWRRDYGAALVERALGNPVEAENALQRLIDGWGDQWPGTVADVYASWGEADAAFEWLARDVEKFGAGGWGEMKLQRSLQGLKQDPRWEPFLTRIGASDAQLAEFALQVRL